MLYLLNDSQFDGKKTLPSAHIPENHEPFVKGVARKIYLCYLRHVDCFTSQFLSQKSIIMFQCVV